MSSEIFNFNSIRSTGLTSFNFSFAVPGQGSGAPSQKPEPEHLPAEIWQRVFYMITFSAGDSRRILPLLLVCRSWKAVAEPVLYDSVIIKTDRQLETLSSRIMNSRDFNGETVGRWLRILDLRLPYTSRGAYLTLAPAGRGFDALIIVLCQTSNLRSFRCNELITPGVLTCLLQSAGASLEDLHITFNAKYTDNISIINRFRNLHELKLRFSSDAAVSFPDVTIVLPNVIRFCLDWSPKDAVISDAGISQLAKSRFHETCSFHLRMSNLSREAAFKLLPLFQFHKNTSISLECPDDAVLTLAGAVKHAQNVAFPTSIPPPALFETGNLPAILSIGPPLLEMDKLWAFLKALASTTD